MPGYPWLYENTLDQSLTKAKLQALQAVGTPYSDQEIADVSTLLSAQATKVAEELKTQGVSGVEPSELAKKEIVAMIAYLQRLGTDIKAK